MNSRMFPLIAFLAGTLSPQVSFERILNATKEPQNWLTYGGTYSSQRYSLLNQITTANAKDLELKWAFPVRSLDAFETCGSPKFCPCVTG